MRVETVRDSKKVQQPLSRQTMQNSALTARAKKAPGVIRSPANSPKKTKMLKGAHRLKKPRNSRQGDSVFTLRRLRYFSVWSRQVAMTSKPLLNKRLLSIKARKQFKLLQTRYRRLRQLRKRQKISSRPRNFFLQTRHQIVYSVQIRRKLTKFLKAVKAYRERRALLHLKKNNQRALYERFAEIIKKRQKLPKLVRRLRLPGFTVSGNSEFSNFKKLAQQYLQFFTWYHKTVCVGLTKQWRAVRTRKLHAWARTRLKFHRARHFFNEDAVYGALLRIRNGISSEERLVWAIKKKLVRLISRLPGCRLRINTYRHVVVKRAFRRLLYKFFVKSRGLRFHQVFPEPTPFQDRNFAKNSLFVLQHNWQRSFSAWSKKRLVWYSARRVALVRLQKRLGRNDRTRAYSLWKPRPLAKPWYTYSSYYDRDMKKRCRKERSVALLNPLSIANKNTNKMDVGCMNLPTGRTCKFLSFHKNQNIKYIPKKMIIAVRLKNKFNLYRPQYTGTFNPSRAFSTKASARFKSKTVIRPSYRVWLKTKKTLTQYIKQLKKKIKKQMLTLITTLHRARFRQIFFNASHRNPPSTLAKRRTKVHPKGAPLFLNLQLRHTLAPETFTDVVGSRVSNLHRVRTRRNALHKFSAKPGFAASQPSGRYTAYYRTMFMSNPTLIAARNKYTPTAHVVLKKHEARLAKKSLSLRLSTDSKNVPVLFSSAGASRAVKKNAHTFPAHTEVDHFPFLPLSARRVAVNENSVFAVLAQRGAQTLKVTGNRARALMALLKLTRRPQLNLPVRRLSKGLKKRRVRRRVLKPNAIVGARRETLAFAAKLNKNIHRTVRAAIHQTLLTPRRVDGRDAMKKRTRAYQRRSATWKYREAFQKKFDMRPYDFHTENSAQPKKHRRRRYRRTPWAACARKLCSLASSSVLIRSKTPNTEVLLDATRQGAPDGLYYVPQYRARARFKAKNTNRPITRESKAQLKYTRRSRWLRAVRLYEARHNSTLRRNSLQNVAHHQTKVSQLETFKRDLYVSREDKTKNIASFFPGYFGRRRFHRVFMGHTVRRTRRRKPVSLVSGLGADSPTAPFFAFNALSCLNPRFPGKSRKRYTFDALLRQHLLKSRPFFRNRKYNSIAKRLSPLNFGGHTTRVDVQALPSLKRGLYRSMLLTTEYKTKQQRALLNRTKTETAVNYKTTLVSSPVNAHARCIRRVRRNARSKFTLLAYSSASALLRNALNKRSVERSIRDLRKTGLDRRVTTIANEPFWVVGRKAWLARRAKKYRPYNLVKAGGYKKTAIGSWIIADSLLRVSRGTRRAIQSSTPWGEKINKLTGGFSRRHHYKKNDSWLPQTKRTSFEGKTLRVRYMPRRFGSFFTYGRRKRKKSVVLQLNLTNSARGKRKMGVPYTPIDTSKKNGRRPRWKKIWGSGTENYSNFANILPYRAYRKARVTLEQTKTTHQSQIINNQPRNSLVSALHFIKPRTVTILTDADKERFRLHTQEVNRQKYRSVMEVASGITDFFPQLISQFFDGMGANTCKSTKHARRLVRSLYWSLRLVLQRSGLGLHASAREQKRVALQLIRRELSSNADARFFDYAALTKARYRLQPHRIPPVSVTHRGARDWLRKFLPVFYNYYTEDSEKYRHLYLLPLEVARAQISSKSVRDWSTQSLGPNMETKYTRLTTNRILKTSTRFENILITTRRAPQIAGYGSATTLKVTNPIGISTVRTSFFSRSYSTASLLRVAGGSHFSKFAEMRTRQHEGVSSQARRQNDLKGRLIARARLHEQRSTHQSNAGSLDIRLTRGKSPRNAMYLQRLSRESAAPLPAPREGTEPARMLLRTNHAFNAAGAITEPRLKLQIRQQAFAANPAKSSAQANGSYFFKRLFTKGNKARRWNRSQVRNYLKKTTVGSRESRMSVIKQHAAAFTTRGKTNSILHFRAAADASKSKYYMTRPTLPFRSVRIREVLWNFWQRGAFKKRLRRRLKSRHSVLKKFKKKRIIRRKSWEQRKIEGRRRSFILGSRLALSKVEQIGVERFKTRRSRNNRKRAAFNTRTKSLLYYKKAISLYAIKEEKAAAVNAFNARRPTLWKTLTSRRMKKARVVRKWVRNVKYEFKKRFWTYNAANHEKEFELFKPARVRARKLIWKESDGRYWRPGLRKAFSFSPSERANAHWLESLIFKRSLYNINRGEYRREHLPADYRSNRRLKKLRPFFKNTPAHALIKRKRWIFLRMYNQLFNRSAFKFCTAKAALKHFRKLSRKKPTASGMERFLSGTGDRLDVNLILLGIAPTVFWARQYAELGLLKINGRTVYDKNYRLKPGDLVGWQWSKIQKVRSYFQTALKPGAERRSLFNISLRYPRNFEYNASLRVARYLRLPKNGDIPENGRINLRLFNWFRLDSGLGKN